MFSRKECKAKARKNLFRHYLLFVFLCLAAAIIGTAYSSSYSSLSEEAKTIVFGDALETIDGNDDSSSQFDKALNIFMNDSSRTKEFINNLLVSEKSKDSSYALGKHVEFGRYRGVLASVVNEVESGAFIMKLLSALYERVGSSAGAVLLLVFIAAVILFSVWVFIIDVFKVIYGRMFLEGRIYKKIPLQRVTFLIYVRKSGKAALTMLLKAIYINLWMCTIIGGIIKHYSYFAVPYIVAENPGIASSKAIKLSRDMMKCHKWECFKLELSFIGWKILDIFTFGISGILYSNPYTESAMCEYYVYIRELAKNNNISGTEELNDQYLYELPSVETLTQVYGPISDYEVTVNNNTKGIWNKLLDFFGIYFRTSENESYNEYLKQKVRYDEVKYILAQEEYTYKLSPIPEKKRFNLMEHLYFNRRYSIWSVIILYALFSFLGWVWEVSQHLVVYGDFVNRGVLHGPWLPIYGTGGVIILLFLNKLRNKPAAEFFTAIVISGIVEYFVGWTLELTHEGQKWWNYQGYFLNIDGRVCAEGLLVFGLGGMIVVYFIAPLLDNLIQRIPKKILVIICIIFLAAFSADNIYSSVRPNTGEGITSFNDIKSQYKENIWS